MPSNKKDGFDGAIIAQALRQEYNDNPNAITIVAFTNHASLGYGMHVPKAEHIIRIGEIVNGL